jgi:hypothetical protein
LICRGDVEGLKLLYSIEEVFEPIIQSVRVELATSAPKVALEVVYMGEVIHRPWIGFKKQ